MARKKPTSKFKSEGHMSLVRYEPLHWSSGGYDGGSCICGAHQYAYTENDSCSYRWQAVHRAETEDLLIYNSHSDPKKRIGHYPNAFHEWYLPYKNNPHHLVPHQRLRNAIMSVAQRAKTGSASFQDFIVQDLLRAEYNTNYYVNMLLLPKEMRDACEIGFPTHVGNHKAYSDTLEDKLVDVMKPYEQMLDAWNRNAHDEPPEGEDLKLDLEYLSEDVHRLFTDPDTRDQVRSMCESGQEPRLESFSSHVAQTLGI